MLARAADLALDQLGQVEALAVGEADHAVAAHALAVLVHGHAFQNQMAAAIQKTVAEARLLREGGGVDIAVPAIKEDRVCAVFEEQIADLLCAPARVGEPFSICIAPAQLAAKGVWMAVKIGAQVGEAAVADHFFNHAFRPVLHA